MRDAPLFVAMLRMLRKDRVLLRNVTIAVVCGSVGAVAIGTAMLGRSSPTRDTSVTSSDHSAQSSAGGVPSAEPAASTHITSTTIIVNPPQAPAPAAGEGTAPAAPPPAHTTVITNAPTAIAPAHAAPPVDDTEAAHAQTQAPAQPSAPPAPVVQHVPIPVPIAPQGTVTPSAGNVPPQTGNNPYPNVGPSNLYPPGPGGPGILGPNSPNGGAGSFSPDPSSPNTPPAGAVPPVQGTPPPATPRR